MNINTEVVDIFQALNKNIQTKLTSLIGQDATNVIIRTAEKETAREYPFIQKLISNSQANEVQEKLKDIYYSDFRQGLMIFLDTLLEVLIDLTGSVLVNKVELVINDLKSQLMEVN